jgi:hypothetical protein
MDSFAESLLASISADPGPFFRIVVDAGHWPALSRQLDAVRCNYAGVGIEEHSQFHPSFVVVIGAGRPRWTETRPILRAEAGCLAKVWLRHPRRSEVTVRGWGQQAQAEATEHGPHRLKQPTG